MERREALKKVALLFGGTIIGADAFSEGFTFSNDAERNLFTKDEELLLNEIGGTILPPIPGSPGAKAANIGAFMVMMVNECYENKHQEIFKAGLSKIQEDFKELHGKSFINADHKTRLAFLQKLDEEQKKQHPGGTGRGPIDNNADVHYFLLMKQLTMLGFFTSEIGCTKALRYRSIPGAYRGCIPYKKGDKAWAT